MRIACFIIAVFALGCAGEETSGIPQPTDVGSERIANLLNSDGALPSVVELAKSQIAMPDTFEHVHTRSWDKGDHLVFLMRFTEESQSTGIRLYSEIRAETDTEGKDIRTWEWAGLAKERYK